MTRLLLVSFCALAACADPHMPLGPDFGNSVTTNIAAQVINPQPNMSGQYPTTDGKRSRDAVERYRNERVYPPIPPVKSSVKEGTAPEQPQEQQASPASTQ